MNQRERDAERLQRAMLYGICRRCGQPREGGVTIWAAWGMGGAYGWLSCPNGCESNDESE